MNDLLTVVKSLCKKEKISIRKLEQSVGFSHGTIGVWNTSRPSIDRVEAVADYFDVSVDQLLGRSSDTFLSGDERRLLDLYRSMSDQGKQHLMLTAQTDAAVFIKKSAPVSGADQMQINERR